MAVRGLRFCFCICSREQKDEYSKVLSVCVFGCLFFLQTSGEYSKVRSNPLPKSGEYLKVFAFPLQNSDEYL